MNLFECFLIVFSPYLFFVSLQFLELKLFSFNFFGKFNPIYFLCLIDSILLIYLICFLTNLEGVHYA